MRRPVRVALPSVALLLVALVVAPRSAATQEPPPPQRPRPERTELPRAVAREALELYNAPDTRRSLGPFTVDSGTVVEGDVAVLEGPLRVAGRITGRVVAINADVLLAPGARIDGSLLVVGGALEGRRDATMPDDVRVYGDRLAYVERGDLLLPADSTAQGGVAEWLARVRARRDESAARVLLTTGKTYNRVEGVPIHLGPAFRGRYGWGEADAEILGILRSADSFAWDGGNLGHRVHGELRLGGQRGVALSGTLFDAVRAVEEWHLSSTEVGLASVFGHRDFRDYYETRGARATARFYASADADLTLSLSDERWTSREARDPWSLLRNADAWRPNPATDEGAMRLARLTLRVDSRNVVDRPWSGLYLVADYEHGRGRPTSFAPLSPGVRTDTDGRVAYGRGFLDVRHYNRVAPDAQLNVRGVLGGWVHGDALPAQRRLSLGGPGTLSGFDFRADDDASLTCGGTAAPPGMPAQCDRVLLLQAEFRSNLHLEALIGEKGWGTMRWRPAAEWVLFADAGRGWLVDETSDGALTDALRLRPSALPGIGRLRTDVGAGVRIGELGLYVSRSVNGPEHGVNLVVRLRERF